MKLTERIRTSPPAVYLHHYAGEGGQWFKHRHGTKYVRAYDLALVEAERDRAMHACEQIGAHLAERDAAIAALRAGVERLSHRAYDLAVAIMGGEDAPGFADSVDTETLVEQMRQSRRDANRADDRAARLRAGITAAVEGRYDRSDCGFRHIGTTGDCPTCLLAHLSALLDPQAPDAGEGRT